MRLSQSEVKRFDETGKVEGTIQFGTKPSEAMHYSLERDDSNEISATYADGNMRVFVPAQLATTWATTDQVGLKHNQALDGENSLRILIEKDFKCLTVRPGEDDNFPNPLKSH